MQHCRKISASVIQFIISLQYRLTTKIIPRMNNQLITKRSSRTCQAFNIWKQPIESSLKWSNHFSTSDSNKSFQSADVIINFFAISLGGRITCTSQSLPASCIQNWTLWIENGTSWSANWQCAWYKNHAINILTSKLCQQPCKIYK